MQLNGYDDRYCSARASKTDGWLWHFWQRERSWRRATTPNGRAERRLAGTSSVVAATPQKAKTDEVTVPWYAHGD
jgi:hypothetical protein